jgi:2Fe-2S ferredoxin
MSEEEESMIDFHEHKNDDSRLSCQISVTADMDGMILKLPESQQ